jgi:hypothetical protein
MTLVDALIIDGHGEDIIFVAGEKVPKGSYLNVESGQVVDLNEGDLLPASLDGRVAVYVATPHTLGELVLARGVPRNR